MKVFERLMFRNASYKACFRDESGNLTVHAQRVIKDLAKFCSDRTSTAIANNGVVDPVMMALNEGRRTVLNRIKYYLNLTDAEIMRAKEMNEEF